VLPLRIVLVFDERLALKILLIQGMNLKVFEDQAQLFFALGRVWRLRNP
jgi:hypothetical protein